MTHRVGRLTKHYRSIFGCLWLSLAVLCVLYVANGSKDLVFGQDTGDAIDLKLRWTEQQYFFRGVNPFDVWLSHAPRARAAGASTMARAPAAPMSDLGVADPGHPPWAYVSGAVLFWPAWPAVRWYFLLWNLAALVTLAACTWSLVGRETIWHARLAVVGVVAVGAISTTLGVGQYGVVVVGCLSGALLALSRGANVTAGVLLGIALAKPTLSGPFALVLLIGGYWRATLSAAAYLCGASLITWAVVGEQPLHMLRQLATLGRVIAGDGDISFPQLLITSGYAPPTAGAVGMVATLLPAIALMLIAKRQSVVSMFAVAAVAARLWTYHRAYDDLIIVFLLLALVVEGEHRRNWRHPLSVFFLLVGVTLWLPPSVTASPLFGVVKVTVWLAACAVVVITATPLAGRRSTVRYTFPGSAVE